MVLSLLSFRPRSILAEAFSKECGGIQVTALAPMVARTRIDYCAGTDGESAGGGGSKPCTECCDFNVAISAYDFRLVRSQNSRWFKLCYSKGQVEGYSRGVDRYAGTMACFL